jgi:hypothetical protein
MAQGDTSRYNRDMDYIEILAALDAEIDLLQRVENILAGSSRSGRKPSRRKATIQKKEARTAKLESTVASRLEQSTPPIKKIPYREKGRNRRPGRLSTTSTASTALNGQVPSTPVVVSAADAQKVRAREAEQNRGAQIAAIVEKPSSGRSFGALIRALARE